MSLQATVTAYFAIFIVFANAQIMHDPNYCQSHDPIRPQRGMRSTLSLYEVLRKPAIDPNASACTPTRFWYVGRQGGKLPDADRLNPIFDLLEGPFNRQLIDNYMLGRTSLCAEDFELIRDFNPGVTRENANDLTESGYERMVRIAQSYQSAFPTLLPRIYNRTAFLFRDTGSQRTRRSSEGFIEGLFGANGYENVEFEDVPDNDTFLSPYQTCPAFVASRSFVETNAFLNGPEYRAAVSQVNEKLGFGIGSDRLSVPEIRALWDACTFFEHINLTEPSPMCSAFSVANNQVFAFHEELDIYYTEGYGTQNRRLTENIQCGLINNLLTFLQPDDNSSEVSRIFIGNAPILSTLMVSLGLFEDDLPMTRHGLSRDHLWKSAWINSKGAHIAAVRYDCADGDNEVVIYQNERPLQIPGCNTNGLCKVDQLTQRYNRFLSANCSELFCSSN